MVDKLYKKKINKQYIYIDRHKYITIHVRSARSKVTNLISLCIALLRNKLLHAPQTDLTDKHFIT